jgi:hypothetical protein
MAQRYFGGTANARYGRLPGLVVSVIVEPTAVPRPSHWGGTGGPIVRAYRDQPIWALCHTVLLGTGAHWRRRRGQVSTTSLGAGWWEASDGLWYPPDAVPGTDPSPEEVKRSGRAVASLVCSCCGVIPLVGLVMAIVGICLGVSARRQIRKSEGWLRGDGIAQAGIIVGTALLAIGIVGAAILLAAHHSDCDHQSNCSSSPQNGARTTPAGARPGSRKHTGPSTSRSRSRSATRTPGSTAPVASPSKTTAPNSSATPSVITLGVFGSGTASSIAVLDASGETEHTDVQLPYATNSQLSGNYRVAIDAQSGSGDPTATITCAINVPGKTLITHTSTGPYAVVHCNTDSGP